MLKHLLPLITFIFFIPTTHAQVVISEVHWVGSDLSSADEWLELAALQPTDISNWYITSVNSSGEEKVIVSIPNTKFIQKDEYFVISNYVLEKSRLPFKPDVVTSSVSLPNSKLLLRLYNASGALIDIVDDGVGAPFAGSKADGYASMERVDLYTSGEDETNWQTATASYGDSMFGSPGAHTHTSLSHSPNIEEMVEGKDVVEGTEVREPTPTPTPTPTIRITEVMADPEGKDEDSEWIELQNAGTGSVSISSLALKIGNKEYNFAESSIVLMPGEYIYVLSSLTGLSLSNKGDTIQLRHDEILIDELEYAQAAEGVSYGIYDNSLQPLCMPTAGKPNKKVEQQIIIEQQSGKTRGTGSVTLNLNAKALNGSISYVDCYWEYSDGFRSMSCNPPSHTFEDEGVFSVELRANNICGDSIVEVLHGKVYPEVVEGIEVIEGEEVIEASSSSFASSSSTSSVQSSSSRQFYQLEVELSEIYPSPESGEDEWVEFYNPTSHPVDLAGWYVDDVADGGSKPWQIPDDVSAIASGERVVFYRDKTKIAFNNSGDAVRLLDPNKTEKILVTYQVIKKGSSYLPSSACLSEVATPGTTNICRQAVEKVVVAKATETTTNITPKQTNFQQYVQKKYKNIVQETALKEEEKSPLLASFMDNTVFAGSITPRQPKQGSMPFELLFYALFVAPGWWFAMKYKYRT